MQVHTITRAKAIQLPFAIALAVGLLGLVCPTAGNAVNPSENETTTQFSPDSEPIIDVTIPHVIGAEPTESTQSARDVMAAATLPSKTIAQLNTWVNDNKGTCFTHPQAGGCKALFAVYTQSFLGHPAVPPGNAKDLYAAVAPGTEYNTYWSRFITGSTPQKGDVAIWGSTVGGGLGHVALVLENVSSTTLRVFHQNWNGACGHKEEVSKNGIIGYIRPRNLS